MPRSSTTFTPATAPKGKGGSKHRSTQIKEAVGLTGFQSLIDYIDVEGAARFLEELKALEGRDFIAAYLKLMEFVKPKPKAEDFSKPKPFEGVSGFVLEEDDGSFIKDGRRYVLEDDPLKPTPFRIEIINTGVPLAGSEDEVIP